MGITHSLHFVFFEKVSSFVILWTLFSKNCQFLDNFDKNLFLPKWPKHIDKISPKFNTKLIFAHLLFTCVDLMSTNRFLSKLSKNGLFLQNKVQKIMKDEAFFHKIQNAENM